MDREKVMAFVKEELERDPDQPSAAIFDRAKKVDKAVKKLTLRQFHARFPLQVKRRKALEGEGNGRVKRRRARASREKALAVQRETRAGVRDAFLEFASALAAAEGRGELVGVLAGVDEYVDRTLGLLQGAAPARKD